MKISLIVSTYNWPQALTLTLESILTQTLMPDEIIIGDDGSTSETAEVINHYKKCFKIPLIHIWQPDDGFRLAQIRNKCIACASGDYIIQIDGDLMLHPEFIADHKMTARPKSFIKGTRVCLDKILSEQICSSKVPRKISFYEKGILRKRETAIRLIPLSKFLAPRFKSNHISGLGCNMSFWREDVIRINGYDEHFETYGVEDDDIALRLHRAGCRKLALRFAGIVYHLWHRERANFRHTHAENLAYCQERTQQGIIRCEKGVEQYL